MARKALTDYRLEALKGQLEIARNLLGKLDSGAVLGSYDKESPGYYAYATGSLMVSLGYLSDSVELALRDSGMKVPA